MSRTISMLLVAGAVLAMGPVIHARVGRAAHDPGIYLAKSSDNLVKIKSVMISDIRTKGIGKSILTQGFSKPTSEAHVPGGRAALRVAAGDLTFFAYLDPNADAKRQQMSIADAMAKATGGGGDGMPGMVKTGKDLGLARLRQDDDERICSVKSSGSLVDGVELVSEKIGTNDYKLTLKVPLTPGEYAFLVPKAAGGGQYLGLRRRRTEVGTRRCTPAPGGPLGADLCVSSYTWQSRDAR